jgi:hypothetical protein
VYGIHNMKILCCWFGAILIIYLSAGIDIPSPYIYICKIMYEHCIPFMGLVIEMQRKEKA